MKYIYAVIPGNGGFAFGLTGIGGRGDEVYTQPYSDVAAVVSDCLTIDFRRIAKEKTVQHLAQHQRVTEEVMKKVTTILPVKFGTMVENESEVESVLRWGYPDLTTALAAMEGKIEIEVVATWDVQQVFAEIGQEKGILKLSAEIADKTHQEAISAKVKLGQMVKASLDLRKEEYQQKMMDFLDGQATDVQVNLALADEVVMNVAFLIDVHRQDDFEAKIHQLDERLEGQLNFRLVGPLPPYSFSTIAVRKVSAQEVEEARRLLGLGMEVTDREIQKAYRRRAKQHHPDVAPEDPEAQERFRQIVAAYGLLSSCCRAQSNLNRTERCSFDPTVVGQTFLVAARRSEELVGKGDTWA